MPEPIMLSDAQARERALTVHRSFIVEAPAGSGKTGLLIQRFLLLLAENAVETPEQVLAITFTRKATAEMRHRILQALQDAARPLSAEDLGALGKFQHITRELAQKVLARDAVLNWGLLQQPQRLNIRTIDSLCGEIAGHLPILSGLGGRLQPVDDARPLYAEAARRTLQELASSDATLADALRLLLLHRDGRLGEVQQLLAEMLGKRDQWARLIPLGNDLAPDYLDTVIRPRLEGVLRDMITAALEDVLTRFPQAELLALAELGAIAARALADEDIESDLAICLGSPFAPKAEASCIAHWRALAGLLLTKEGTWRKSINKTMGFPTTSKDKPRMLQLLARLSADEALREALFALNSLPPAQYSEEEWRVSKALFHLLRHGMAQLRVAFAERLQCDFIELSMASVEALAGGDSGLAAAMGMRFRHLLVDEMQDTSISQYNLLKRLTQGWDGAGQTIFLVGDPRQSIYLFRQARVEQFARAISEHSLGDIPLEHLQLTANFRSHHALVAAFNEHFATIRPHQITARDTMPPTPAAAEREIKPARFTDADPAHIGLHWHPQILNGNGEPDEKKTARALEAATIGALVEAWCERPLMEKHASIAVLVRAKSHLTLIAEELRKRNIRYRAVEIDALAGQQEVLDALSLLRALLHPADRVAWLSVLRAPWCGLSLHDLHTLSGGDDTNYAKLCIEELIASREQLLSTEGRDRLQRTHAILTSAATQRGRLPVSQWVQSAWHSLGAPLYLTAAEYSNVHSFFHLLDACEEQGDVIDAHLLLEKLGTLFAPDSQDEAVHVELMSIHKAKGLEWDVVFVPSLDRRGGSGNQPLLEWLENPPAVAQSAHLAVETLALLAPIPRKGVKGESLHSYVRKLREQVERMEQRRVFYVATTRAREELHLFGQLTPSATGTLRPTAGTLLHAAWPAAEQHFATNLLTMPAPQPDTTTSVILSQIAAAAQRTIRRIPAAVNPAALYPQHAPLPAGDAAAAPQRSYRRTEGSLSARALGTVVHAYLDRTAQELATGATARTVANTLDTWLPGITAMLRTHGLAPNEVQQRAVQALTALHGALADQQGQWLLAPHPQAASEYAVSTWSTDNTLATYRMDRTFRAGDAPGSSGEDLLWIVDYKITAYDSTGEAFLAAESEKHRSQLEAYARVQYPSLKDAAGIRLAAFYPLRTTGEKLKVWKYEPIAKP